MIRDLQIRVAVLIPSGVGADYGGPKEFLARLASVRNGCLNLRVYSGSPVPSSGVFSTGLVKRSLDLGSYGAVSQLRWSLASSIWLLRDRRHVDVVHFHGTPFYAILPALLCKAMRMPFVLLPLSSNADMTETGKLSKLPFVKRLRRQIVRAAGAGIAISRDIAAEMVFLGMNGNRVRPMGNPFDSRFLEIANLPVTENLIFIGSIGHRKRPLLVLEALALLPPHLKHVSALFIGPFKPDGYSATFWALVHELGLEDRVTVTGFVTDVAEQMKSAPGIFILPSSQEGLPGALVEAVAAGRPAIVTDVGGMGDLVRDANCGHVVAATPESISHAIEDLMTSPRDLHKLSENARDYALRHYSPEKVFEQYVDALRGVIRQD